MMELKNKLPKYLHYHCWQHTAYVLRQAEIIAKYEKMKKDEILLIKTAALFHDIGFIKSNKNHEELGVKLAKIELPKFGYKEKEIEIILGIIRATKIPQSPKNKLEEILADADLEYLGTDAFQEIGDQLFLELKHENDDLSREKWDAIQIDFLQKHNYFTSYCLQYRLEKKMQNLQALLLAQKK